MKILALFSVVRGYNLIMLALAMYFATLFIFAPNEHHLHILLNKKLNLIVCISVLCAAAGYIINNFYDLEKDNLQKPIQTYVERFISHKFKLNIYLSINALALILAIFVSWRVFIFFLAYQFLVWLYSHKINKIVFLNNIYFVILMILPFFALFIFYENFSPVIFVHAAFLCSLLLIMNIFKDLTSVAADTIYGYRTLPVVYGEHTSRKIVVALLVGTIFFSSILTFKNLTGFMSYYFAFCIIIMLMSIIALFKSQSKVNYMIFYYFYKILIGIGVISIAFIEINPLALQNIA